MCVHQCGTRRDTLGTALNQEEVPDRYHANILQVPVCLHLSPGPPPAGCPSLSPKVLAGAGYFPIGVPSWPVWESRMIVSGGDSSDSWGRMKASLWGCPEGSHTTTWKLLLLYPDLHSCPPPAEPIPLALPADAVASDATLPLPYRSGPSFRCSLTTSHEVVWEHSVCSTSRTLGGWLCLCCVSVGDQNLVLSCNPRRMRAGVAGSVLASKQSLGKAFMPGQIQVKKSKLLSGLARDPAGSPGLLSAPACWQLSQHCSQHKSGN